MISLKKNDKIIIIAAVAVIIIAGIGIAAYTPEEVDVIKEPMIGDSYTVVWETKQGSPMAINGNADKNSVKTETFTLDQHNLKTITINMSWVDDRATILNRFGLDTLRLTVTDPNGEETSAQATSARRTKQGKVSITLTVNSRPPAIDFVNANSTAEAEMKVEQNSSDLFTNEEFQLGINVMVGERRPLKKFRDKGNGYNIEISYEYYEADVIEEVVELTGDDLFDDLSEQNYKPPFLSMIIGTGCGRYI